VLHSIAAIPIEQRKNAHRLALSMPIFATTISEWVDQQLRAHRQVHTLKTALCVALNPTRTQEWVCNKSGGRLGHIHIAKGLALHLRMHPFTWLEVKEARDILTHHKPCALKQLFGKDPATLEAAAGLVVFQREARMDAHTLGSIPCTAAATASGRPRGNQSHAHISPARGTKRRWKR
tara:strand:+ start:926 stop:1459 length:534 start_codon:yes stop_codon:yes gene_type:complete